MAQVTIHERRPRRFVQELQRTAGLWESSDPGDVVRLLGGLPMGSMANAILELRAHGEHALADELAAQRDVWERVIDARAMQLSEKRDHG